MSLVEVLVALLVALGLVGILLPVLPGTLLVAAALLGWAVWMGSGEAWTVFAIAAAILAGGAVLKYLLPGRRLQAAGVPLSTQLLGALLGVVGFFLVPVVGLFIGFPLGIYLAELRRLGPAPARTSTVQALKAIGLSILIELLAGVLAAAAYAVGVVVT